MFSICSSVAALKLFDGVIFLVKILTQRADIRCKMTLVLTAICPGYVVQVADRLLTTVPQRDTFDQVANKTVVYRAMDGIVTIAYTGAAYIENVPTDEWIAGILWGQSAPRGPDGLSPTIVVGRRPVDYDVGLACIKLQEALQALSPNTLGPSPLKISVSGFMESNERGRPVWVEIIRPYNSTHVSLHHLYPRGIVPKERDFVISQLGAHLDRELIQRQFDEHNRVNGPCRDIDVEKILASLIREKAAVDQTVGSELMSVIIPAGGRDGVVCRFLDTQDHYSVSVTAGRPEMENVPIGYSPWLVGLGVLYPPSEQTYINIVNIGQCECTIIPRVGEKLNGPGVPGIMSPQKRRAVVRTIPPPADPGWQTLHFDTRTMRPNVQCEPEDE
jgi:hypothetical protein